MTMNPQLAAGMATGIGSLPHRDAAAAARFSLSALSLPVLPTLPKRSPAEGIIGQAIVGINGVSVGQYGSIAVDAILLDPAAPVVTDLQHDAFGGFRSFLEHAASQGYQGPVKWQFVGPVTFGVTLVRAGVPADIAFDVAANAVRSHLLHLHRIVRTYLPNAHQVVLLDEPVFDELLSQDFLLAPDVAIDHVSMAMSALESVASIGVHSCGMADVTSLLATGPAILSVPVHAHLADSAGYLARFLDDGGIVAWGIVPTQGPITSSAERPWRALSALWCELVQRGVDPVQLRTQSLVTPECGLGAHTPAVADRVHRITAEVGRRVQDQAIATRFSLGA